MRTACALRELGGGHLPLRQAEEGFGPEHQLPSGAARAELLVPFARVPARSRCRCGGGEPGPGADVAGVSPVPVQMWPLPWVQADASNRRAVVLLHHLRSNVKPAAATADVCGEVPVPVQMWEGRAQHRWRRGRGELGDSSVPVPMWKGRAQSQRRFCGRVQSKRPRATACAHTLPVL